MTTPAIDSTLPYPKLRDDLTFARQETPERAVVVVKDPAKGKFFRLGEEEEFIARQLDGHTPLETVRARLRERFSADIADAALAGFVGALGKADLLDDGKPRRLSRKPKPRVHGSLLRVQFRAFDPTRLFERLAPLTSWCYTPPAIAAALATMILAVLIATSAWGEITAEIPRLLTVNSLPAIIAVVFVVISAHEFAHGLTCRRFGGAVHEVGFMLIYFQPAFFCDVSDAWLIPERYKRVWVSVAGPFVELLCWSLAVIAWRFTEADTAIHAAALIAVASCGLRTLVNFNPLVKLDGYYILSDLLRIPNLRRRAFAYVGSAMKRLVGIDAPVTGSPSARERAIYLVYGLVASAGTVALLAAIITSAGGYFLESQQPLLFLGTAGLVVARLKRRFKKLFLANSAADDDEDNGGIIAGGAVPPDAGATPTPEPPEAPAPAPDTTAPAKKPSARRLRRWRRRAGWMALAVAILGWLGFADWELHIAGPFTIRPEHNADVRSEIQGIVAEVLVTEGDTVAAGDVLVRLSARDSRAELQGIGAEIDRANARLRLLQMGTSPDSIELARAVLARALDTRRYAESRRDRIRQLTDSGFATPVELEEASEAADRARNDVTEAERKLQIMSAGTRREEVEASRAELSGLESKAEFLRTQLRLVEVKSPAAGIVATPARELRELRGQLVQKGALLAKVFELRRLRVEIAVPEKDIGDVKIGAPVQVRARAWPGRTFAGHVVAIAPAVQGSVAPARNDSPSASQQSTSTQSILVTTEINNDDLLLKAGMSGQAKIVAGKRPVRQLALRRLLRTINLQLWALW